MSSRFRWLMNYPSATFLVGSCVIAAMVISIWVIEVWEYLPEWVPIPGPAVMNFFSCFRPIVLFLCGIPTVIAFLAGLSINIKSLISNAITKNLPRVISFILGVVILGSSSLPLIYKNHTEKVLKNYAISRYDVVIDAIEKYHVDHGSYPPSLDALVPTYLNSVPGKYMKFGEQLYYYPDPTSKDAKGYVGYGPFIFELSGMYAGIHGQTLKYCPIEDETCKTFNGRIDDRWIWTYDTIL